MAFKSFFLLLSITAAGYTAAPTSRLPFTYVIDYASLQETDPDFRRQFLQAAPTLFHPGPELRYLGRFGFGGMVTPYRNMPYATYEAQVKEYLQFLRAQGVRWITPYLCNQTISGNDVHRYGVWEVYDRWQDFAFLGLGEKPQDPILWMQREPSGNLHYNYKRKCFLERHQDDLQIRYAPCPNNPDWRNLCNAEARNAGRIGFDGYFIDNNIIHCYCAACERRFQDYLRAKYTPDELYQAFATRDYGAITLYHEGDLRWWARSFDGFIPWLERKYPQSEWPIHFDTADSLQEVNVDAAGGGMLYGETEQFVAERILSVASPAIFESLRLANPALQTPIGRLRWAETQMFWNQSIGDMLAEMRDAGRETNPDFFLMPNWGVFQRIDGAIGRAEDGKDIRRWRHGADWQMFEEDYATGLLAPGVLLDYDLELRYAFSCGVRAMLLPYTLNDPVLEEVHHAEAAASGGSVFVTTFRYPQVREKYRRFFETNADLYEGYSCAGRVALAFFYDQYYYLNIDHFRQVYALNRFLADQQIPFDYIHEGCLDPVQLSRYQAIILPNVVYLSNEQIAALKTYVGQGGTLITIGETATQDLCCRPRDAAVFNRRIKPGKRHRHFNDLHQALPHRGIDLDDGLRAVRKLKAGGKGATYQRLAELDHALHFKRYQLKGPLTDCLAEALGGNPHLMDPMQASGLRHTLWRKQQGRRVLTVLHLVNKNVRLDIEDGPRRLQTVTNLKVALPAEPGRRLASAVYRRPDQETAAPLRPSLKQGRVVVTIPYLSCYGVIQIEWM
ncbi:MAG TPA: beta-galactosidase trimerization domain-containing protein [bacterium]|nr:beta-galactosidase trimerization domain-containing protein [bacterium]HPN36406.1 beta-galactosidase trimerization domain-containing protein [bacterium]